MTRSSIRPLMLVIATALVGATVATPPSAGTSHRKHIKMHRAMHWNGGLSGTQPSDRAWTVARPPSPSDDVCPGSGRSFECKIWPPPMDQDPDRKMPGADGN